MLSPKTYSTLPQTCSLAEVQRNSRRSIARGGGGGFIRCLLSERSKRSNGGSDCRVIGRAIVCSWLKEYAEIPHRG